MIAGPGHFDCRSLQVIMGVGVFIVLASIRLSGLIGAIAVVVGALVFGVGAAWAFGPAGSGLRAPLASGRKLPAHRPAGRFARPSAIPGAAHRHRMDAGAGRSTRCQNIAQGTLRSEDPLPDNLSPGLPGSTATIRSRRADH